MKYKTTVISSPVNGRAIPLTDIPDPVFAEKVLGDGCGIIPSDGRIYSPADGVISSVAAAASATPSILKPQQTESLLSLTKDEIVRISKVSLLILSI